jgi:kynurenine formamidase
VHWVTGKDYPNNTVDTIDPRVFIAPAVVVDCSAHVAANPDWLLTVDHLERWEEAHGRIPEGAWLLFRTGLVQTSNAERIRKYARRWAAHPLALRKQPWNG